MKINQVEELVGITKKNIRFYEDQDLITPDRNPDNGYREYNLKNVDELMKIKLLRKLSVPIEEIRKLQKKEISFDDCMELQINRLDQEQQNAELMKSMCQELIVAVDDLDELKPDEYLQKMKRLEQGGTKFMDIEKRDVMKKNKTGSLIAALVMIVIFAAFIALIIWAEFVDPIPVPIFIVIVGIIAAIIVGTLIALKQRFNEIDKGEDYEARKY